MGLSSNNWRNLHAHTPWPSWGILHTVVRTIQQGTCNLEEFWRALTASRQKLIKETTRKGALWDLVLKNGITEWLRLERASGVHLAQFSHSSRIT